VWGARPVLGMTTPATPVGATGDAFAGTIAGYMVGRGAETRCVVSAIRITS